MIHPAAATAKAPAGQKGERLHVYIGTYTGAGSEGIYLGAFNLSSGKLEIIGLAAKTPNPSFVALHPSGEYLYAVNEVGQFEGEKTGSVSAFAIDPQSHKLHLLNQRPSAGGAPCHLVVDQQGRNVLVANYSGGSVACLPIGEDGALAPPSSIIQHEGSSVDPRRQQGPHAHSINLAPQGNHAVAADLGLDQVLIYRFDAEAGKLTANDPPHAKVDGGSGPRHFVFHPSGKFGYVINELTSTVTAFAFDSQRGALEPLQTLSTLPADYDGKNSTAEVRIHPSGRFLYGSNRGHDSIAIFAVDQKTGKLTALGHESTRGQTPRNFNIDPTGTYLLAANQSSGGISVLRIDFKSGELAPVGRPVEVPNPVCIRFLGPEN